MLDHLNKINLNGKILSSYTISIIIEYHSIYMNIYIYIYNAKFISLNIRLYLQNYL